jgi:hypothetical protein
MILFVASESAFCFVVQKGHETYIVDKTGERWNVTQAKSIGFMPERFQYGIGKDAFTPLDDSHLSSATFFVSDDLRVIGIADGSDAKAYSIPKLTRHEIANSMIGSKPVAVGY